MKKIIFFVLLLLLLFIQLNTISFDDFASSSNLSHTEEFKNIDTTLSIQEEIEDIDTTLSIQEEATRFELPNATFFDIDGNEFSFEDFYGKPLVINLWATWCGYCLEEMPYFQTAYDTYGDDVNFLFINMQDIYNENMETATTFINENEYNLPFYFDTNRNVATVLRVRSLPTTFFINSDGTINNPHIGMIFEDELIKNIENLMN